METVIDQTVNKETLITTITVVTLPHHQSTQLNVILLDVTDYLFNVTYVLPLSIFLEIAQKKQKILKLTERKSIYTCLANLFRFIENCSFDVHDCMHTCQHIHHQFNACKKQHTRLVFITFIVWDIGTTKMREIKTSNLIVIIFL